jgi:prepilin signal peptidase PulO-like enzyme (type II secretory pathway)
VRRLFVNTANLHHVPDNGCLTGYYSITPGGIREPVIGGVLGIIVFLPAFFISGKRLGLADVWYAALSGIVLGPLRWYPAVLLSCVFGFLFIVISRRRSIPFIPCMAAGSGAILILAFLER